MILSSADLDIVVIKNAIKVLRHPGNIHCLVHSSESESESCLGKGKLVSYVWDHTSSIQGKWMLFFIVADDSLSW